VFLSLSLKDLCRSRKIAVGGTKEILQSRLRDHLFEKAELKDEEKKILMDFANKKGSNRRDFKAAQQRLEEKGYERGILEIHNILQHLVPSLYPQVRFVFCCLLFALFGFGAHCCFSRTRLWTFERRQASAPRALRRTPS